MKMSNAHFRHDLLESYRCDSTYQLGAITGWCMSGFAYTIYEARLTILTNNGDLFLELREKGDY